MFLASGVSISAPAFCGGVRLQQTVPYANDRQICGTDDTLCHFEKGFKIGSTEYSRCAAEFRQCLQSVKKQNQEIEKRNRIITEQNNQFRKCEAARNMGNRSDLPDNRWKLKNDNALERNERVLKSSKAEQDYNRELQKRRIETEEIWKRNAIEAEKQRRVSENSKTNKATPPVPKSKTMRDRGDVCGPDPTGPESTCGSASNPCQYRDIVRWNRCMGNPGY
jgi:hypothetical protein